MSEDDQGGDDDLIARVQQRVLETLVAQEASTMEDPHIVVRRTAGTSIARYLGPFPTGLEALVAADAYTTAEDTTEYEVVALVKPAPLRGRHRRT